MPVNGTPAITCVKEASREMRMWAKSVSKMVLDDLERGALSEVEKTPRQKKNPQKNHTPHHAPPEQPRKEQPAIEKNKNRDHVSLPVNQGVGVDPAMIAANGECSSDTNVAWDGIGCSHNEKTKKCKCQRVAWTPTCEPRRPHRTRDSPVPVPGSTCPCVSKEKNHR